MKPISQLLAEMEALDADVPSFSAPASESATADPVDTEPESEQREADVDDIPDGEPVVESPASVDEPASVEVTVADMPENQEPTVEQPATIDDPTQPSVTVDEMAEQEEPSVAVTIDSEPSVTEMDVPEEPPVEVQEPSVESVSEPSVPESTVEPLRAPDTTEPFVESVMDRQEEAEGGGVEEVTEPSVSDIAVQEQDEPSISVEQPQAIEEPSVPESGVEALSEMPDTTTPVGDQGTFELPAVTIDEYNSEKADDVPDQSDVDRQVANQIDVELQRGDDLATRLHEELRSMISDSMNSREQTVREVVEMELATMQMMQEE